MTPSTIVDSRLWSTAFDSFSHWSLPCGCFVNLPSMAFPTNPLFH